MATYNWAVKDRGRVVAEGYESSLTQAKRAAEAAYVSHGMGNKVCSIVGPRSVKILMPSQRGNSAIGGASWR